MAHGVSQSKSHNSTRALPHKHTVPLEDCRTATSCIQASIGACDTQHGVDLLKKGHHLLGSSC